MCQPPGGGGGGGGGIFQNAAVYFNSRLPSAPGRRLSPWGGVVLERGQEHPQRQLLVAPVLPQPALATASSTSRSAAAIVSAHVLLRRFGQRGPPHELNRKGNTNGYAHLLLLLLLLLLWLLLLLCLLLCLLCVCRVFVVCLLCVCCVFVVVCCLLFVVCCLLFVVCLFVCCLLLFVRFVRAHNVDMFSSGAIHGERHHCSLRGHSSHDQHPWVKIASNAVLTREKFYTRCDQMRLCHRLWRVYSAVFASRFWFSNVVVVESLYFYKKNN